MVNFSLLHVILSRYLFLPRAHIWWCWHLCFSPLCSPPLSWAIPSIFTTPTTLKTWKFPFSRSDFYFKLTVERFYLGVTWILQNQLFQHKLRNYPTPSPAVLKSALPLAFLVSFHDISSTQGSNFKNCKLSSISLSLLPSICNRSQCPDDISF